MEPSFSKHKFQKVYHAYSESANESSGNCVKSVAEVSAEKEFPCNKLDSPSYHATAEADNGHSDFDKKFLDLIMLLNNVNFNTSDRGMLREEVSSDLREVFCETSTISSSGHGIVQPSPEPIRNAATQGVLVLPPRRFYRTFWLAMARRALTSAEMAHSALQRPTGAFTQPRGRFASVE